MFQGRFKAMLVEKDAYLFELSRYIHLNPVRAGMVDAPEKYQWGSLYEMLKKKEELPFTLMRGSQFFLYCQTCPLARCEPWFSRK